MAIVRKKAKNIQSLRIERVFQSSRLADEFMASAYENVVPISRKSLNATKRFDLERKSWSCNKEERKCVIGT
jgi:hypothetical protein